MLREATVCFLRGRFILPRNSLMTLRSLKSLGSAADNVGGKGPGSAEERAAAN